jgi:hypothetical protein
LAYALDNRSEWEAKGQEIVAQLVEDAELKFGEIESPERLIRRTQALRMNAANQDVSNPVVDTTTKSYPPMQPLKGNEDQEQATCSITSSATGLDSPDESELELDNEPPGDEAATTSRGVPLLPVVIEPSSPTAKRLCHPTPVVSPNRKKKLGVEARFI